ncbi:MAG: beta galactosidase jelly roll domain-containing protein, partial [Prevotella sp.]|nr:beta galactosidase jelly roll domain-containing protein [Prevotella sp.]
MKKLLDTLMLVWGLLFPATLAAESLPLIQNVNAYECMSLNGEWNYIVDVQEEGYYDYRMKPTRWGFFQNAKPQRPEDLIEYDFDKSPTMQIPGDWNTQDERLFFYEGTVWFKKSFQAVPTSDCRTLLYFGAVNYDCRVWVNGKEVGHHIGGFTPFNFDISDLLREGENVVIVKVDNKRHAEDVPTQIFDWWNYGGITRDVKLVKVLPVYLEDYNLQLTSLEGRQISFSVKLNKPEANHTVTLNIPELKIKKTLTTAADGTASVSMKAKPQLWSPENPKRYQVEITLDNSTIADSIGFRKIETRGKQILLNGQPIFLKGISIHEEKPNGGGRANSPEDARTLLSWAKELGCNFVRLAHYPHNEYMVREAERMGILVWSEIPCYWT